MKKILNSRVLAFVFISLFTVANTSMAIARPIGPKDSIVPVEMKFAGFIKQQPVFQLNFTGNPEQNEFTIIVTDEYGVALYRETIAGETFTKNFQLNTDEIGDNTLRFEIFSKKTKRSVVYEVNRYSRFVQDIAIRETR